MPVLAIILGGLLGAVVIKRRQAAAPARAVIMSPSRSTVVAQDGAVRSIQSAEFSIRETDLEPLWTPENLENLARTYWRFLSRVTVGLIRVIYSEDDRRVALLIPQLTLLRFEPPRYYSIAPGHGRVCWRIQDGLLVARAGRGSGVLQIDVHRETPPGVRNGDPNAWARVYIEIAVANFYPSIASNFSLPVYMATQSWIHVLVTHGFLRSLARLDLAESRIGNLRDVVWGAVTAREARSARQR